MTEKRKPIERTLVIGSVIFTLVLCALLSIITSYVFSRWFYSHYNSELQHVLVSLERTIDKEDLQECMNTGVASEKYDQLQSLVNSSVDDFEMAYIYILIPYEDGSISSVCASTSEAEREAGDAEDWPIMYYLEDGYTPETIKPYMTAWEDPGITYFANKSSEWGNCYTACMPLVNEKGETFALLCADYFIDDLQGILGSYVGSIALFILAISAVFVIILISWLRRNVTGPIRALESSARNFAEKSSGHRDPSALLFKAPDLHTNNELKSLSDALVTMSEDMRDYVQDIISAEERAQSAEEEAEGMMRIAYEDPLTHVASKAAYEIACDELEESIEAGDAQFAIIMIDLNKLKTVNDTFGHKHGDAYIVGSCGLLRETFKDTPIYRIGGDEFVVILQGEDYERRLELLEETRDRFASAEDDESRDPWERYSASVGMSTLKEGDNRYQVVFSRADDDMYRLKKESR